MHEPAGAADTALDALVPRLHQFVVVAREEADTARGLVGAGLGVSLLPATTSSLADPAVAAVPITTPKAARTVGIAWPADRPLSAPAAAFRDFALTRAAHLPH